MLRKPNIHTIFFVFCSILLAHAIMSEPYEPLRSYKLNEAIKGIACIGLSVLCWKIAKFFDENNRILGWIFMALSVFVFFPLSAIFFQNVSIFVAVVIFGYVAFYTIVAAGGSDWDGRDPGDGGD